MKDKILMWLKIILGAYIFLAFIFAQFNPLVILAMFGSGNPIIEAEVRGSVDMYCNRKNTLLLRLLSTTKGYVDTDTREVYIKEGMNDKDTTETTIHENCHKRQIEQGLFDLYTCEDNYTQLLALERECKYEGLDSR